MYIKYIVLSILANGESLYLSPYIKYQTVTEVNRVKGERLMYRLSHRAEKFQLPTTYFHPMYLLYSSWEIARTTYQDADTGLRCHTSGNPFFTEKITH